MVIGGGSRRWWMMVVRRRNETNLYVSFVQIKKSCVDLELLSLRNVFKARRLMSSQSQGLSFLFQTKLGLWTFANFFPPKMSIFSLLVELQRSSAKLDSL